MSLPIEIDAAALPPLGMPPDCFLRDYWQKRPLLIRNAFPDFLSPLAPEDLAGLACEESALARLISHDRATDTYALRHGPFREEEFPGLPDHDWTLLVQDVDKWDADVRALLPAFDFLPRWRIDDVMISFAARGGSVGAHVDQYDVFLLQAQGHRRWQVDDRADAPKAFREDAQLRLLRTFAPTHDWVLAPGDMLYLPPGVPHHGVAEDACLTFSIGMRAPSAAELVADFADHLAASLPDERRYADPGLGLPADPFEIDAAALERVSDALRCLRENDADALRTWFGGFITTYRSAGDIAAPTRTTAPAAVQASLDAGATLLRHPYARLAWARGGDGAQLFASGQAYPMSVDTARRLAAADALDVVQLDALDPRGRAAALDLLHRGLYVLKPARKRGRRAKPQR